MCQVLSLWDLENKSSSMSTHKKPILNSIKRVVISPIKQWLTLLILIFKPFFII